MEFAVRDISRCANNSCPNQQQEGRFVVCESKELVVGGHRRLTFIMCAPCAAALAGKIEINVQGGFKHGERVG